MESVSVLNVRARSARVLVLPVGGRGAILRVRSPVVAISRMAAVIVASGPRDRARHRVAEHGRRPARPAAPSRPGAAWIVRRKRSRSVRERRMRAAAAGRAGPRRRQRARDARRTRRRRRVTARDARRPRQRGQSAAALRGGQGGGERRGRPRANATSLSVSAPKRAASASSRTKPRLSVPRISGGRGPMEMGTVTTCSTPSRVGAEGGRLAARPARSPPAQVVARRRAGGAHRGQHASRRGRSPRRGPTSRAPGSRRRAAAPSAGRRSPPPP